MPAADSLPSDSRLIGWGRILGPTLAALAIVGALLLPGHTFLEGYDWVRMQVYYKTAYREALLSGAWPHWNPFISLGRPFLADIEVAFFYPPNLLYLAGPGAGLLLSLWLHFALLLHGMLHLLRGWECREATAWFGALGFALGAPLLGRLQSGQIQVFCALCWLPWLFVAGQAVLAQPGKKSAAFLAAVAALLFLAGSPPVCWISGWALAAWLGSGLLLPRPTRDRLRAGCWLAAAGALAAGLVAVQLLPFLELVHEGNRLGRSADFALQHPLAAQSWWSLLRSKPGGAAFFNWEYNLYAGLPLVLLALGALTQWRRPPILRLAMLAGLFGVLALGATTPLLPALVDHVPGWDALRYPARYAIIVAFAGCLLAALTLEQLARWLTTKPSRWAVAATPVLAGLILLNVADTFRAYVERSAIYASPATFPHEQALNQQLRTAGLLQAGLPPPRVIAPPWLIRENSGLQHHYSTLSGFANPVLAGVWTSLHRQAGLMPSPVEPLNLPAAIYAAPAGTFAEMAVAARWNPQEQQFDLADSPPACATLSPGGPDTSVTLDHYASDRILLTTTASAAQTLTLAEPWYPGWTALIDGTPTAVHPAGGWMRAVAVPAGKHRIELRFRSRWLTWGAALSLGALALAAVWLRAKPKVSAAKL